jgi:mono/diheme cytochrome c family protein
VLGKLCGKAFHAAAVGPRRDGHAHCRATVMRTRLLATVLGLAAFATLAAAGVVALGLYDVAATTPHTQAMHALLETTMQRSVRRHARRVDVPQLDAPASAARGAGCFRDHCIACHGGPGVAPQPLALAMQPLPGPLAEAARRWDAAELYWITRHGIKMSGMPAWEHRLADADLWATVAFVQQLADLTPAQFAERLAAVPAGLRCERGEPLVLRPPDAQRGRRALAQYGCRGCHVIDGVVGSQVHVGPPLSRYARRERLPGGLPATPENLVRWLRDPASLAPQTAMPALGVGEQDARDIAAYLQSLR